MKFVLVAASSKPCTTVNKHQRLQETIKNAT
jgi:hypothetical protein